MTKEKLIILGSGPAGFTASIYAARAELAPLVFEGSEPGGQLIGTTEVENFPGFPKGITGPQLMNDMREQAKRFGAKTIFKSIDKVDFSNVKNLKLYSGTEEYSAKCVIIATGASARWLPLEKGEKYKGKGYSACATCDGAFFREKTVAVVGGGDSAIEEADFLTRFTTKVYLIHRRDEFRASKAMQARMETNEKIEPLYNKTISDMRGENLLESVELTDTVTNKKSELELNGLFVAIGHTPNTKFLDRAIDLDERGFIQIQNHTHTNIPSVFVAGDVADPHYQQAITAAGGGCMAALDAEKYLAGL